MTRFPTQVNDAVILSHYGRLLTRGESMRARAQGAYATLSTLAGGILGVGLLTNLAQFTAPVRLLGLTATALWTAAAAAFVFAGSGAVRIDHRDAGNSVSGDTDAFVSQVIGDALEEQRRLRGRARLAVAVAAGAAAVTTAALVGGVARYPPNVQRAVPITLNADAAEVLVAQCRTAGGTTAVVDVRGLSTTSGFLEVTVAQDPGRGCRILLPRAAVLGVLLP